MQSDVCYFNRVKTVKYSSSQSFSWYNCSIKDGLNLFQSCSQILCQTIFHGYCLAGIKNLCKTYGFYVLGPVGFLRYGMEQRVQPHFGTSNSVK